MKMTATLPDGSTRGLLWIGDWDFGWQDSYFYTTPIMLPRGTRLDIQIAYDNSTGNLRNPNTPPKQVRWRRRRLGAVEPALLLRRHPRRRCRPQAVDDHRIRRRPGEGVCRERPALRRPAQPLMAAQPRGDIGTVAHVHDVAARHGVGDEPVRRAAITVRRALSANQASWSSVFDRSTMPTPASPSHV